MGIRRWRGCRWVWPTKVVEIHVSANRWQSIFFLLAPPDFFFKFLIGFDFRGGGGRERRDFCFDFPTRGDDGFRLLVCFPSHSPCNKNEITRFYSVITGSLCFDGFTRFYLVLLSFTGFYWLILSYTGFYWVLLGFTGFYWVLPDSKWVLPSFIGF